MNDVHPMACQQIERFLAIAGLVELADLQAGQVDHPADETPHRRRIIND